MPRIASARSCSTMTVSAPTFFSSAGDSVPQNGQMSACLAGFQFASAPHAGQLNFCRADATCSLTARSAPSLQEVGDGRLRDPPLGADLPALEVSGFEARDHVG